MKKFIPILLLITPSCLELRLSDENVPYQYIGNAISNRKYLDPKLGSRGKLWLKNSGDIRPYIGGAYRKQSVVTGNISLILYPSATSSVEFGIRHQLFSLHRLDNSERYGLNDWEDSINMFYLGGMITW